MSVCSSWVPESFSSSVHVVLLPQLLLFPNLSFPWLCLFVLRGFLPHKYIFILWVGEVDVLWMLFFSISPALL